MRTVALGLIAGCSLAMARDAAIVVGGEKGRIATTNDGISYTTIATCGATDLIKNMAYDASADAIFAIVGNNKVIKVSMASPTASECGTTIATLSAGETELRRISADGAGQYVYVTEGNPNLGTEAQQGGITRIPQSGQGSRVSMYGYTGVTGGPNGISLLPQSASSSPPGASSTGTLFFSVNGNSVTAPSSRVQGIMRGDATQGVNATVEFQYSQSQDWWPDGIVLNAGRTGGFYFEHRVVNGEPRGAVQSFNLPNVTNINALVTGLQLQDADRPGLAYDSDEMYLWFTLPSSESGSGAEAGRIVFQRDQNGVSRTELALPTATRETLGKAMSVTYAAATQNGASFDYTAAAAGGSDDAGQDDTGGADDGDDDVVTDDDQPGADDGAKFEAAGAAGAAAVAAVVALGAGVMRP